jgi:hypothetical protein
VIDIAGLLGGRRRAAPNGFGGGNSQGRNGNTGSAGSGGAHNNLQPSAVVRWLIKV